MTVDDVYVLLQIMQENQVAQNELLVSVIVFLGLIVGVLLGTVFFNRFNKY